MGNFDFSGWATRANLRCSDGRTIMKDAFKHCDGQTVPLVWNHQHADANNVLGHALLENRDEGVYAYGTFNDTESGQNAKLLVQHGDISALSIYANQLQQRGGDVIHGAIREVSLVLAGANPGAHIDSIIAHGVESDEEAVIFSGENIMLYHADNMEDDQRTVQDVIDEMTDEQRDVMYALIGQAVMDQQEAEDENGEVEHSGMNDEVYEEYSDEDDEEYDEEVSEEDYEEYYDNEEGDYTMKHNVFEGQNESNTLSHADMQIIFDDAKRCGSLKDAVLAHAEEGVLAHAVINEAGQTVTYGMANIDFLFPEAKTLNNEPDFIKRNQDWVAKVMNAVHHTPFSRIKSVYANITMDEARAKGYIKGKKKTEEVFALLKRSTTPTTIYKKQKLDRDDILDITDFDVVAWLKREMRMMLDEEIARAILIGDGRLSSSDDKVNPLNIRPVWTDDDLYTIKKDVTVAANATNDQKVAAVVDGVIEGQENYEGSGNPVMFCDKWFLTRALLVRNAIGERLYKTKAELADEMGVSDIIPVPVFKNQKRTDEHGDHNLVGIIVNLNDYNVGADKGGEVNMFDDFDIDYNQMKYLIETRCSGALTKPYSAIAIEMTVEE